MGDIQISTTKQVEPPSSQNDPQSRRAAEVNARRSIIIKIIFIAIILTTVFLITLTLLSVCAYISFPNYICSLCRR